MEKVASLKDSNTLELSSSVSTTDSNTNSKSSEDENCDITSLPKIIRVHAKNDIPATPVMFEFNLDDSGNWRCGNCNNNNIAGNERCASCGATHITHFALKNEANQTHIKRENSTVLENMYASGITSRYHQNIQEFPRIRVENEEGISVHSDSDAKEYNAINSEHVQSDNNAIRKSTEAESKYIESSNQQVDERGNSVGTLLEQNAQEDNTSLCSNVTETVGQIIACHIANYIYILRY